MKKNTMSFGIILILISAIGYGLMPIISKLAYDKNMNISTLLFSRFSIASVFLWSFVFLKKLNYKLTFKQLVFLVSISFFGFTMASITIFKAYELMSGSIATLILFAHPVFVVLIEIIFFKAHISYSKIIALFGTIIGLCFVVLSGDNNVTFVGLVLSFVSSICYALFCIGLTEKSISSIGGIVVTAYVISISSLFNFIQCISSGSPLYPSTSSGWTSVILLAVFSTIIASVCFYEGIRIVGASSGTMISTVEPVFTIFLSMLILKESLNMQVFIGAFIIIGSIIFLSKNTQAEIEILKFDLVLDKK